MDDLSKLKTETIQNYLVAGVSAFVAEDDSIGHHILSLSKQLGLSCPQDFSLAVLGNPLNPMQETPDWTSFNIPRKEMGQQAMQLLVEMVQARRSDDISLPLRRLLACEFVVGDTVS